MFDTFDRSGSSHWPRLFAAAAVAVAGYAVLYGALSLAIGTDTAPAPDANKEKPVEVAFRPPPPPPPAAIEPPPPPAAKPPPPKAAAPRIARATPPPRPALVAPMEAPLETPEETEPTDATPTSDSTPIDDGPTDEVEGSGHYAGHHDAPPAPSPVVAAKPVHLPENATPPVALDSNPPPEFPTEARSKGLEGMVILRLVVSARGEVQRVEVLKGDEPFSSAALAAVQAWRYRPALSNGQPIAVFQTVRIPFRLRNS